MLSIVLFISGGEIFIILLFILIFFGADRIPEFTRMMNKGMREFKKASDDIKREFTENTSGVMNDIRSIQHDLTESLTKEIAEPVQKTVKETEKTLGTYTEEVQKTVNEAGKSFDEYQEPVDYYYQNSGYGGNEYRDEADSTYGSNVESTTDASVTQADTGTIEPAVEEPKPKSRPRTPKAKAKAAKSSTNANPKPEV